MVFDDIVDIICEARAQFGVDEAEVLSKTKAAQMFIKYFRNPNVPKEKKQKLIKVFANTVADYTPLVNLSSA